MPAPDHALRDGLARSREIRIKVTGRRSGRSLSIPVWFVLEAEQVYLLPARGSDTQWYKKLLEHPAFAIKAGRAEADFTAVPLTARAQVSPVIDKFRAKYGADGLSLYSKLDVAVRAEAR